MSHLKIDGEKDVCMALLRAPVIAKQFIWAMLRIIMCFFVYLMAVLKITSHVFCSLCGRADLSFSSLLLSHRVYQGKNPWLLLVVALWWHWQRQQSVCLAIIVWFTRSIRLFLLGCVTFYLLWQTIKAVASKNLSWTMSNYSSWMVRFIYSLS